MISRRGLTSLLGLALTAACASVPRPGGTTVAGVKPSPDTTFLALASEGDSQSIAGAVAMSCRKATNRPDCYEAFLVVPATRGRVKVAMGALDMLGILDPEVRRSGHVYAHAIGIAAGKGREDIAAPFAECSESYQSGCYHGVIQAWFAAVDTVTADRANALCAPFRRNESDRWIRFQCVHGMGHGLTMFYEHDLRKGLAGCDLLTEWWDRHSCYSGAFMENIVNVTMPHHPASELSHHSTPGMEGEMAGMDHGDMDMLFKAVDPTDQQYPCSAMADRYLTACYEMQTSVMLFNNKGDIAGAARGCDAAPLPYRPTCYASLGRDISSYSVQNHAKAIRMCALGSPKYNPWCINGVVKNFIDLNARVEDGLALCRDVREDSSKLVCYAAVGEQVMVLAQGDERRRALCSGADAGYLDACLYGARVSGVFAPPRLVEVWNSVKF